MRALRGRGGVVIGAFAVCALALTGCAAGKKAPTANESPAIDGMNAAVGTIALRDIAIATPPNGPSYAQGASAKLQLVIVNNGNTADSLTGITTPAAASVGQTAAGAASGGTSTSAAAGGSSSGGSSSGSSSAATTFAPIQIGPQGRMAFGIGTDAPGLVLNSLTAQLYPAAVVSITFTFQNAGAVTVQVPVQITQNASAQVVTAGLTAGSSGTG